MLRIHSPAFLHAILSPAFFAATGSPALAQTHGDSGAVRPGARACDITKEVNPHGTTSEAVRPPVSPIARGSRPVGGL